MAAMDRRHLLESESLDPASLICVNPYEVNPLSNTSNTPCATLTADIPLKVECSVSQQNQDGISCGGFYGPPRKIKLEMEEFGDLSPFVSQKRTFTNSIDELNTPIFDKDAFDFDINYENNVLADLHVKLKYDKSFYRGGAADAASATHYQPRQEFSNNQDIFLNADSTRRNVTILPLDNIRHKSDNAIIYSPPASDNGTYIENNMSPDAPMAFGYDLNSVSVNLDSRNPSPYGQITPEGSEKSYNPDDNQISSYYNQPITLEGSEKSFNTRIFDAPKLSLDINLGNFINLGNQNSILDVSTPNLIAEVVNLEATGFNILDLINDDNLPITTDDIFSPSTLPIIQPSHSLSFNQSHKIAVKQPRKRRLTKYEEDDDDDEDYVPPTKKSSNYRKNRAVRKFSDSDSEEEEAKPRKKGRGRPPKRKESISSDCSLGRDSDVSKYRELRDKNNEASRKSRMKRRIKEVSLEKEADELHNKNIKLKAQVEELEKMVNNFRDNLFKIMINK